MTTQVIDNSGIPAVRSYADALRVWEAAKIWDETRPNVREWHKRKTHMLNIVKYPNEIISCRYHATDVVAYYPDGSILVEPYESISTNKVMEKCLPDGMSPDMCNCLGQLIYCMRGPQDLEKPWHEEHPEYGRKFDPQYRWRWDGDAEVYCLNGPAFFKPRPSSVPGMSEWVYDDSGDHFNLVRIDRAKLRAFKKEVKLKECLDFLKMWRATMGDGGKGLALKPEMLRDRLRWKELLQVRPSSVWAASGRYVRRYRTLEEDLEILCLTESGCLSTEEVQSLPASQVDAAVRMQRKYGNLV